MQNNRRNIEDRGEGGIATLWQSRYSLPPMEDLHRESLPEALQSVEELTLEQMKSVRRGWQRETAKF